MKRALAGSLGCARPPSRLLTTMLKTWKDMRELTFETKVNKKKENDDEEERLAREN
jgi:hypothetical protein